MENKTEEKILLSLGEIKGEVKGINNRLDRMNGSLKTHDSKIDCLERDVNKAKGITTIISILFGVIGAALFKKLW